MADVHLSYAEIRSAAHDLAEERRKARNELESKISTDLLPPCWIWLGGRSGSGYGQLGSGEYAHRYVYQKVWGPIPDGLEIHHTCQTKICVNPDHLRAMTRAEHIREHGDDYCKLGHPFDKENTFIGTDGGRECRRCRRERQHANQAKRNAQARERRRRKKASQ